MWEAIKEWLRTPTSEELKSAIYKKIATDKPLTRREQRAYEWFLRHAPAFVGVITSAVFTETLLARLKAVENIDPRDCHLPFYRED